MLFLCVSCDKPTTSGKNASGNNRATQTHTPQIPIPKSTASNAAKKTPEVQDTQAEVKTDPRIERLQAEHAQYADYYVTHSAAGLTNKEKALLRSLLAAAEVVEALHMLQLHPKNLTWKQALEQGQPIERKIFNRYQMPWCAVDRSPECAAMQDLPARAIGQALWPENLTKEAYDAFEKQINATEILSPFTVVQRREGGGFEAIPYAETPLFKAKMKQLADLTAAAAAAAKDPTLKAFLKSRAKAFVSTSAFPYDTSDLDWLDLKGRWEVTMGPYETHTCPYGKKAFFTMIIGQEDAMLSPMLNRLDEHPQDLTSALSDLVGDQIYRPRRSDANISIRAVDEWYAAGEARLGQRECFTYHLPHQGKAAKEGRYKKVVRVNRLKAQGAFIASRLRPILDMDKSLPAHIDPFAVAVQATYHEVAHGLGAHNEMMIGDPEKPTAVALALKELTEIVEEVKAEALGMWLVHHEKEKGLIGDAEIEKKRYVGGVMRLIALLRGSLEDIHTQMAGIVLGSYIDSGGIRRDADTSRLSIDFDKLSTAVLAFARRVATIQFTGDYKGAAALVHTYITKSDAQTPTLKGEVAEVRSVIAAHFEKEGPQGPFVQYTVTDLSDKKNPE